MKLIAAEILCVVFAVVFIYFTVFAGNSSDALPSEIAASVSSVVDTADLIKRDNSFVKKTFGFDPEQFECYDYYSSDNVMDVRELLCIRLSDPSDRDVLTTLGTYVDDRYNIFASYAPREAELLENKVLLQKGCLIFLYIGPDSDAARNSFLQSL